MSPSPRPNWRGHTCVIVASGPSLTDDQCKTAAMSGAKLLVINDNWMKLRAADAMYACDFLYFKVYRERLKREFKGQCWTQDRAAAERYGLNWVRQESRDGLGKNGLRVGGNGGHAAINLAYLFGCRRMLLIGYDMQPGPKGEKHYHPDHPTPLVQAQQFDEWIKKMKVLAADLKTEGVEVINCTLRTALKCFPMGDLETEIAR